MPEGTCGVCQEKAYLYTCHECGLRVCANCISSYGRHNTCTFCAAEAEKAEQDRVRYQNQKANPGSGSR